MAETRALLDLLLGLPRERRFSIFREAGAAQGVPSILTDHNGPYNDGHDWLRPRVDVITALTLRYVDPPDAVISRLFEDGALLPPSKMLGDAKLRLASFGASEPISGPVNENEFSLVQVLAGSTLLFQLYVDLAAGNEPLGVQIAAPQIRLNKGSLEIAVGGGLLASGICLIVGCAAGLVGAPLVATGGGVILATAGLIEFVVSTKKAIADRQKTEAETRKTEAERHLTEVTTIGKRLEIARAYSGSRADAQLPESADVPRQIVQQHAEECGCSEAYAVHILNRGLPALRQLKLTMAGVEISATPVNTSRRGSSGKSDVREAY